MFTGFNAFNESDYNFTTPFNSTIGNLDYTNASRHFAEQPDQPFYVYSKYNYPFYLFAFVALFLTCTSFGLAIALIVSHYSDGRLIRRNQNGDAVPVVRPDILTLYRETMGEGVSYGHFGEEFQTHTIATQTPAATAFPADMFPSFSDSSGKEKLFSDTITTPLSNNSIITMTMRNNHLIVETEERIPISCSMLNVNELYNSVLENPNAFVSPDLDEYQSNDLDDFDSYSSDHGHNAHFCSRANEERGPFYEPTTSRQADEEDQHIELFHKNILAFPSYERGDTVPSCSYEYSESQPSQCENDITANVDDLVPAKTGLAQSDLTGSSSSTSRHVQNNYNYGNQSEYVLPEFPLRKHSSSFKLSSSEDRVGLMVSAYSSPYLPHQSSMKEDSVLQLTDCSSSEFSEPSK